MANQQQNPVSENIFQRFLLSVQAFLSQSWKKETWQTLWHWALWRVVPKRRRILKLIHELQPLDPNAAPEMRALRDEVFLKSCLELKRIEEAQVLLDILKHAQQPLGYEQIFFAAIYPVLIKRDMEVIPILTEARHRLDVEIGYLGYNEDYFFWVLEIDGTKRLNLNTPLAPRLEGRDDKRYVVYPLGSTGLVDTDYAGVRRTMAPRLAAFNNGTPVTRRCVCGTVDSQRSDLPRAYPHRPEKTELSGHSNGNI